MKNSIARVSMDEIFNNKKKYANLFSENNLKLEEILLLLWNKGIQTKGCCVGHDDGSVYSVPYLGLDLNSNVSDVVELLSNISKSENVRISFVSNGYKKGAGIYNGKYEDKNNIKLFDNILEALKKNYSKIDEDIKKICDYILTLDDDYVNIHLYYNNLKRNIYFNTDNIDIINKLKKEYKFTILNEKCNYYSFLIVKEY